MTAPLLATPHDEFIAFELLLWATFAPKHRHRREPATLPDTVENSDTFDTATTGDTVNTGNTVITVYSVNTVNTPPRRTSLDAPQQSSSRHEPRELPSRVSGRAVARFRRSRRAQRRRSHGSPCGRLGDGEAMQAGDSSGSALARVEGDSIVPEQRGQRLVSRS